LNTLCGICLSLRCRNKQESLRAQACQSLGAPPDCDYAKLYEKKMQDEMDRFNRRMTEKAEWEMRPPGKQKFHFVTKART
jgi:hypothetical protein